jgi:hypothetical protein
MALNKDAVTAKVRGAVHTTEGSGVMKERNIRLPDRDWQLLKVHFDGMGLSLAAGVRMALSKYMTGEGLR